MADLARTFEQLRSLTSMLSSMYPIPTARSFAVILGFDEPAEDEDSNDVLYVPKSEYDRIFLLDVIALRQVSRLSEREKLATVNQFCALYLPRLAKAFAEPCEPAPPPEDDVFPASLLYDPCLVMLHFIGIDNPYFARFMLSEDAADLKDAMATNLADRILKDVIRLEDALARKLGKGETTRQKLSRDDGKGIVLALDYLTTLLFLRRHKAYSVPIPDEVKTPMVALLRKWNERWPAYCGDRTIDLDWLIALLTRDETWRKDYKFITNIDRGMLKHVNVCGAKGCRKEEGLAICKRCKTVAYCCKEHQKAHWRDPDMPHKDLCFETTF